MSALIAPDLGKTDGAKSGAFALNRCQAANRSRRTVTPRANLCEAGRPQWALIPLEPFPMPTVRLPDRPAISTDSSTECHGRCTPGRRRSVRTGPSTTGADDAVGRRRPPT
jgi:hypothetical protein